MRAVARTSHSATNRRQAGSALFITVLLLILIALLAISAIRHSEDEATSGARSRSTTRSLYAADGGIQVALSRLTETPPNLVAFSINLPEGANVQSRSRSQSDPVDIQQGGIGVSPEGFGSINAGHSVGLVNRIFNVDVTATAGGSTTELESKLNRLEVEATGY